MSVERNIAADSFIQACKDNRVEAAKKTFIAILKQGLFSTPQPMLTALNATDPEGKKALEYILENQNQELAALVVGWQKQLVDFKTPVYFKRISLSEEQQTSLTALGKSNETWKMWRTFFKLSDAGAARPEAKSESDNEASIFGGAQQLYTLAQDLQGRLSTNSQSSAVAVVAAAQGSQKASNSVVSAEAISATQGLGNLKVQAMDEAIAVGLSALHFVGVSMQLLQVASETDPVDQLLSLYDGLRFAKQATHYAWSIASGDRKAVLRVAVQQLETLSKKIGDPEVPLSGLIDRVNSIFTQVQSTLECAKDNNDAAMQSLLNSTPSGDLETTRGPESVDSGEASAVAPGAVGTPAGDSEAKPSEEVVDSGGAAVVAPGAVGNSGSAQAPSPVVHMGSSRISAKVGVSFLAGLAVSAVAVAGIDLVNEQFLMDHLALVLVGAGLVTLFATLVGSVAMSKTKTSCCPLGGVVGGRTPADRPSVQLNATPPVVPQQQGNAATAAVAGGPAQK